MSNGGYITLLDWMVKILHLNGNELVIYGIIHGYSQDGKSTYSGSTAYLQETSGASLRCVKDVLEKLVAKGLLVKKDEKSCIVTLPDGSEKIIKAQGGANHFCKYYTAISRDRKVLDTYTSLSNNSKQKSYGKTYITILNWMVKRIGLTSNELVIYAIIHGFSQNSTSHYWGSIEYLSQISGASVRCVINILEKLVKKGLLIKIETNNRIYEKEDGEQVIQKAQGGANHYCKYYTAISRNPTLLNSFNSLQKVPSAICAYGDKKPTAHSALGIPSAISAYGMKTPTAHSALGNINPSAINADVASANSAYVASANSAHNIKYNNKTETTTQSYNLWNVENLDFILENVFGSGGLFQNNFKNRLITFLNSKELNIATAKKYLEWAYEQAKLKAKTDELGYFITVIDRDTFYSQFLYYNKNDKQEEETETLLHCPVCDSAINKNQLECPCCHTDVVEFSDTKNIAIKRNIWLLPPDKKLLLEEKVKEIGSSMLSIHGNRFNGKTSIDELQVKTYEVYKEFGVLEEV